MQQAVPTSLPDEVVRRRARSAAAVALICTFALFEPGLAGARGGPPVRHPAVAPGAPAPARLADTGLYEDFAARRVAADVLPYTPQYPLWSDGATKRRWIRLPPGAAIDASDPDAWVFPVGTKLWKEFSFERRVETGSWSGSRTDVALRGLRVERGRLRRAARAGRGIRGAAESRPGLPDIPSVYDCRLPRGGPTPVLGFSRCSSRPIAIRSRRTRSTPGKATSISPGSSRSAWSEACLRRSSRDLHASPRRRPGRARRSATSTPTAASATTHAARWPRSV
jgi:hypothetical protein